MAGRDGNGMAEETETGEMPRIGDVFAGRYLIEKVAGQGGMGIVYAARDTKLAGRRVALKITRSKGGNSSESSEAATLMRLDHPNLPRITDYYPLDKPHRVEALVMEYIEGSTLAEWLVETRKPMTNLDVLRIGLQLCSALLYLHEQPRPIIHRDLKPSNIMIDSSGTVKLIDFGISRIYKEGKQGDTMVLGTSGYAAPEMLRGLQSDARSDIYSLGAVMLSLLTGTPTSDERGVRYGDNGRGKLRLPAAVRGSFAELLERLLHWNPESRFQSMREVETSMRTLLGEDKVQREQTRFARIENEATNESPVRVVLLSLSGGAGATLLTITLAVLLARRGRTVTAAEYAGLPPVWCELLPAAIRGESELYWKKGEGAKGLNNRGRGKSKSEAAPVRWLLADQELFANDEEDDKWSRFELELRLNRGEFEIVDLSGDWEAPESVPLIRKADHIIVIADPDVYKWQPARLERLKRLRGESLRQGRVFHYVANKHTNFGYDRYWLSMLPDAPSAIVPLLPQEKIWSLIWSGKWLTDHKQLDQMLSIALQPLIDKLME
ncbi:hypothetical protein B1748_17810 [Paenibacillus sp. MY03]|nr:hypothetical protein B1748_17810 [Paenibacillus sp. MY03]